MKKELAHGFSAAFDSVGKDEWHELLSRFSDAHIYQTWSYEAVMSGEQSLSHMILKKDGEIVAAAQARIARVPLFGFSAAYMRWGPMWRLYGRRADPEVLKQALRALHNEYVVRRRLVLRIRPLHFDDQAEAVPPIFAAEGFRHPIFNVTQHTLLIDLTEPVEELRRGLQGKWRKNLKTAEESEARVEEGTDDALFEAFLETYRQTHERKGFLETSSVQQFRRVQQALPDHLRMRVWVAFLGDKPAAGVISSCIGETGLFLYGGTSDAALKLHVSNLLHWKALIWIKEQGARSYNLGGVNRGRNPGTYQFKSGLCGKNGREVCSLGVYDALPDPLTSCVFQALNLAREVVREARIASRAFKIRWRQRLQVRHHPSGSASAGRHGSFWRWCPHR